MTAQIIAVAMFAILVQVARREHRLYLEHRAEADIRLRRIAHQERIIANGIRPRTGQVAAAPRVVPINGAEIVRFPLTDFDNDRPAA